MSKRRKISTPIKENLDNQDETGMKRQTGQTRKTSQTSQTSKTSKRFKISVPRDPN